MQKQKLKEQISEAGRLTEVIKADFLDLVLEISELCTKKILEGGGIFCAGNGGSAADADHFVAELVGSFNNKNRKGIKALSLSAGIATPSSISNDFGYENIFSRQLEAMACEKDFLIVLSTSGNSENIVRVLEQAKKMNIFSLAMSGESGGRIKGLANREILIPSNNTARIQEAHMLILHLLAELIENKVSNV